MAVGEFVDGGENDFPDFEVDPDALRAFAKGAVETLVNNARAIAAAQHTAGWRQYERLEERAKRDQATIDRTSKAYDAITSSQDPRLADGWGTFIEREAQRRLELPPQISVVTIQAIDGAMSC